MTTVANPEVVPVAALRPSFALPSRVAFWLLASIVIAFLAGSSAPTPLYPLYQAEWGFTPITVTVVFGLYAVAVLASLLVAGSLSDHVGRRPVLLGAVLAQAVTMIIFATAAGLPELLLARVVQGLSTGAALGAIGAGMLDIDRARGTVANAVAPAVGTAIGALGSGLFVQLLPAPAHAIYLALFAVFAVQAVGVWFMRETVSRMPGALGSLRPRVTVPRESRSAVLMTIPVLVAVWSLPGLFGSLGPALVRDVVGANSAVLGGLALFLLTGTAAIAVFVTRDLPATTLTVIGPILLLIGVAATIAAIWAGSAVGLFAGIAIAGAGFGPGFQGAFRSVVPLVAPHQRAGVLSVLFTVSYLAMGFPAIIAGILVVHGGGLVPTAEEYGAVVLALAAVALVTRLRTLPKPTSS